MPFSVRVGVPATTANLGPGFDCLGLAIDLWNEAEFIPEGDSLIVEVCGEGEDSLARSADNLVIRTFQTFYETRRLTPPPGLRLRLNNHIPCSSGLGSSSSAIVLGLLGANSLSGSQASTQELLDMAAGMEGHADNVSPALLGGLVVSIQDENYWLARRFEVPILRIALVLPDIDLPTQVARQALPLSVPRGDAVYNISRAVLVAEALRLGDLDLLGKVMDDRLHQPYRLPLIRGAAEAMTAARSAGAQAVAISGAGPSLIAFCAGESRPAGEAMAAAFARVGLASRIFDLVTTSRGAWTRVE